jgi:hypothetical protein
MRRPVSKRQILAFDRRIDATSADSAEVFPYSRKGLGESAA